MSILFVFVFLIAFVLVFVILMNPSHLSCSSYPDWTSLLTFVFDCVWFNWNYDNDFEQLIFSLLQSICICFSTCICIYGPLVYLVGCLFLFCELEYFWPKWKLHQPTLVSSSNATRTKLTGELVLYFIQTNYLQTSLKKWDLH